MAGGSEEHMRDSAISGHVAYIASMLAAHEGTLFIYMLPRQPLREQHIQQEETRHGGTNNNSIQQEGQMTYR